MKKQIITAVVSCLLGISVAISTAHAQQFREPTPAKEISAEDAAKTYPPPKGGYPVSEVQTADGIVESPYPPHRQFRVTTLDGKAVKRGALILDPFAKKVFVRN